MTLPPTMRQFYYPVYGQGWNLLKQRTVPLPALKPDEVLVKIHAVSLQYRDIMNANGTSPEVFIPDELVPGSDMAGEVVAIGDEVTGAFKVGDRVSSNFITAHISGELELWMFAHVPGGSEQGVLQDYRVFKPESLVPIPEHLSYEEASTLPCAAVTAYNALMGGRQPLKAGDTVLILGTGGVSIFGLQLAVASGATVIVTSSSDDKLKLAKKLGAKHGINYKTTPQWDEEVLRLTGGRGVDHVLEVSGPSTIFKSLNAVKFGGQIVIIGEVAPVEHETGTVQEVLTKTHLKLVSMRGVLVGSAESFKSMNRLIAANPDTTRPVVDKVFEFDQTIEAFEHLNSQKHVGKVVISLDK
ncbi:NAD-P-binding protein [Cylindrobasidium torrendii FP15055 ss-10]|uniref:NAD-P-binding protein n=1 Tax=Cylindrobasidium torrendii FP15055 ss-10 TaxID=1314674 RepID=A0A0D7B192_9AGAR|nr:NAD-P-binding protein [Cylindrobasidium torrendii FP15055 ss-10]